MTSQQYNQQQTTKKAALLVLITTMLLATTFTSSVVEAFRPINVKVNSRPTSSSTSKLFYVVFGGDQEIVDSGENEITELENNNYMHHGNAVVDHDNDRSFWLQSLQNLESSHISSTGLDSYSMWTKIACAYAPAPHDHLHPTLVKEAVLVRVGETDLDVAVAVPATSEDTYSTHQDQHLVQILITVPFPDGTAFNKDAHTFEDELTAVIHQVRLLERDANDRLLHEQINTDVFASANDPNYYTQSNGNSNTHMYHN